MIVQCARCTCPLDANSSTGTVTCTYCGTTQPVASLQVLRNETPPGWQPPPFWAPPPGVQTQLGGSGGPFGAPGGQPFGAPTGQPFGAPYGMQPGMPTRTASNGPGCAIAIGVAALVAIGAGGAVFALMKSRPMHVVPQATPVLGTFSPDVNLPTSELSRAGTASGYISASSLQANCRGYISSPPDLVIRSTDLRMYSITTAATEDLTMVVGLPGGSYFCDDDSGASMNPLIHQALPAGTYPVWVGTYRRGIHAAFTLQVEAVSTALAASMVPGGAQPNAPTSLGTIALDPAPASTTRAGATAGGPLDAHTMASSCRGWVSAAPTATVQLPADAPLELTTIAHDDLTMVVQTPSGEFACDDDSGGALQPRVTLANAQAGAYRVWVGEYSQSAQGPFALRVTTTAPGSSGTPRRRGK